MTWWHDDARQRPRLLPCPLPPIARETTASYLARLATANHIDPVDVTHILADKLTIIGVSLQRLAAITGRPVTVLAAALPELFDPRTGAHSPIELRGHAARPLCRRCAARYPHGHLARIWTPTERHICLRHQLWTGDAVAEPSHQINLAGQGQILHAETRHRRLARRFGRRSTHGAYTCARDLWASMTWRGFMQPYHDIRHVPLTTPTGRHPWRTHDSDPTYLASNYPETVILAALIASPYWRHHALADDDTGPAQFHTEFAHRLAATYTGPPPHLLNLRTLVLHAATRAGWQVPTTVEDSVCPPASRPAPTTVPAAPAVATSGSPSD